MSITPSGAPGNRASHPARPWRRPVRLALALLLLALAAVLARPVWHLGRAALLDDGSAPSLPPPGTLDDASRLQATRVAEVFRLAGAGEDAEAELAAVLARARAGGQRVSVGGARHSMGGQSLAADGVFVDMRGWNEMELDEGREILTVQSGALWHEVIPYLDARGRSVAVMQSNDSFSVGGSLSVNCHGWQYGKPPIASTVESLRLMLADGSIVRCSRNENAELFSLVLGGYGLFGIILETELRVVPNERYRLEQLVVPVGDSLAAFDARIRDEPRPELVYARMGIVPGRLFDEVILNAFFRAPGEIPPLRRAGLAGLRRAIFRGSAVDAYGKELRWSTETRLQPLLATQAFSRNQLLNEGAEVYANRSQATTDILHEYFVPRERAAGFVARMRSLVTAHEANLLNVTVRTVEEDRDTFLRYADRTMLAFVMLFVQERTPAGERRMRALTRELVEAALEHRGRYYLPYRLHATPEQFRRAYPRAEAFFERKRRYDPGEVFQNGLYEAYGDPDVRRSSPLP